MSLWFGYVSTFLVALGCSILVTELAMLVTTVYLHRHLAHGGVQLRPEVRAVSRFIIWISTGMKPRQWAQVHRYHHAAEDTPNDPHSPRNFGGGRVGARHVFWHNGPLYTEATRDPKLATKYRDLVADRWDRWIFDRGQLGVVLGIASATAALGAVGYALIGGWIGALVGGAAGALAAGLHFGGYLLAGGVINGYGHAATEPRAKGGYSRNMPLVALVTVGEGWHWNHHAAENSPRLGIGRQFDPGWAAIRVLCGLRLARITERGRIGVAHLRQLYSPATA